jgi:protein-S-isoprenylcysteine O-methyltransferase Ste14
MALTYPQANTASPARVWGSIYAWAGFALMWVFWVCFLVFLADPRWAAAHWPLSTVESGGFSFHPLAAAIIDLSLVALFGLQHSVMARPWFKEQVLGRMPAAFERCTFVHAANLTLFVLIVFWQPIPIEIWDADPPLRQVLWAAFAAGWIILLFGALSFGIFDLLGIEQMRAWYRGKPAPGPRLKTGFLYRWLPHPMYVGVLLAMWATPRMSVGHMLLAASMTVYVLIALRYEKRDLAARFGAAYTRWRGTRLPYASAGTPGRSITIGRRGGYGPRRPILRRS